MVVKMLGAILPIIGTFVIILIIIAAVLISRPEEFKFDYPKYITEDWFQSWMKKQVNVFMSNKYDEKSDEYQNGYEDCYESLISAYDKAHPGVSISISYKGD